MRSPRAGAPRSRNRHHARPDSFARSVRWTIGIVVVPALLLAVAGWLVYRVEGLRLARLAVIPRALEVIALASGIGLVLWLAALLFTYLATRPLRPSRAQQATGALLTMVLGVLVTVPMATTSYYALTQRDTLNSIATNEHTQTAPVIKHITKQNPWGDKYRVNVLLLGGDGGVGRAGIRTDTVILLSINTHSGKAVMFSLPRNLRNVPFPQSSPLHAFYPNGFDGCCTPGESMLNAIYRNVPAAHPGALGRSDNEGADAVKLAVSGALDIPVDYYLLVNLDGFRRIVRAMGGITVNVNERVPINGNSSAGIPPTGYIEPGPAQHLDGFHALWFTRGRYGLNDYHRMERQRCAIRAIVDQASPGRLLARYTQLAAASRQILRTDIPQKMLPAFVDTALTMKGQSLRSVVFQLSGRFNPNNPDYDVVHAAVHRAIRKPAPTSADSPAATATGTPGPGPSAGSTPDAKGVDATDTTSDCQYRPVSADGAASTTP